MAATRRSDLPDWMGEGDGAEGIGSLVLSQPGQASRDSEYLDDFPPEPRSRSRWKRCCICSFVMLSLIGLAIGLTVGITKKNPQQLFSGAKLFTRGGGAKVKVMEITSPAFDDGGPCPIKYTADGDDASPPLVWSTPPEGTESLVLIADDPIARDGKGFTHWLVMNIPADKNELIEGIPPSEYLTNDMKEDTTFSQGMNDANIAGYTGPDPPEGSGEHTYYFRIYALSDEIDIGFNQASPTRQTLKNAMNKVKQLGRGEVTCTYGRD